MNNYYTRACNFYFGKISKEKVKLKNSLPLNGDSLISFDCIEIIYLLSKKENFFLILFNFKIALYPGV